MKFGCSVLGWFRRGTQEKRASWFSGSLRACAVFVSLHDDGALALTEWGVCWVRVVLGVDFEPQKRCSLRVWGIGWS